MKAATVKDLKNVLEGMPEHELLPLLLRLIKFKKENKELVTYLVFDASDENAYIQQVKESVEEQFSEINKSSLYFIKKSLRKILRLINRYSKYSSKSETTIELLIFFCRKIKDSGFGIEKSAALMNLYESQKKKIKKEISVLHEDLQYDYMKATELL